MGAKPRKNQGKSNNHGGARPNSGRKPKPVTEIKKALIAELAGTGDVPTEFKNDAAAYAFRLFNSTMRDPNVGVTTRLDCATEILNRVWGKSTERHETKTETTHVFISQLSAALDISYGDESDQSNAPALVNGTSNSHSV
jgi:hypothetical protein